MIQTGDNALCSEIHTLINYMEFYGIGKNFHSRGSNRLVYYL